MSNQHRITSIPPEVEAKFPMYVDKWLKIGLSTDDTDVENALKYTKLAYERGGLVPPTEYRVYDSPFQAIEEVKREFDTVVTHLDFCYGAHDAGWLSFYDVMLSEFGIEECQRLDGLTGIASYCGWWIAFDNLIVLTRKPTVIKFDDNDVLHCENGPAIEFKDGNGIYVWHGTAVPDEWIKDKTTITPEVALYWENVEQRRCACEIVGWDNVIKNMNSRVIDADVDEYIGTLLEVEIPNVGTEKFLRARCGTGIMISIPVPPEMTTALEANSWSYGIDKFEFKPDFRT